MTTQTQKKTNESRGYRYKQTTTSGLRLMMPAWPFLDTRLAAIIAVFLKKSYFYGHKSSFGLLFNLIFSISDKKYCNFACFYIMSDGATTLVFVLSAV